MNNMLSFFKMFDLAFFVPGVVLFGVLKMAGVFPEDMLKVDLDTVEGVVLLVGSLVMTYGLGLIVHGVNDFIETTWSVGKSIGMSGKNGAVVRSLPLSRQPWFVRFLKKKELTEVALYFWYLKATCFNLGTALVLTWVIVGCRMNASNASMRSALLVGAAAAYFQGWKFAQAHRIAVSIT